MDEVTAVNTVLLKKDLEDQKYNLHVIYLALWVSLAPLFLEVFIILCALVFEGV